MGCACSRPTANGRKRGGDSGVSIGYEKNAPVSYDSCELLLSSSPSTGSKVMSSFLGKAGAAGFGRAIEVLDVLGSSMSNITNNNNFASGLITRGNKISILAFEVANTISKGANLLTSLSKENIQLFKDEVLLSDAVTELVSSDMKELISIIASDKREELHVFSREVIRFGDLCKDPGWHNLDRYFQKLDSNFSPEEPSKEYIETTIQQLMDLAKNTAELYHQSNILDRFEKDYKRKLLEEELHASRRESLMILQSELQRHRKVVRGLQKKSLWSRSLEEVVEKLVEIVIFLHKEITQAFGSPFLHKSTIRDQTLGASGLALHYANIINQIDNIVCRPFSFPTNTRETLYHGLPPNVKVALRSRLRPNGSKEKYTVSFIKAEMQKTLRWLLPIAESTIRAHQAFGWVGEWANFGASQQGGGIARIQTLYHAYKAVTESHILELVVWLHHLVTESRKTGYGLGASKIIRSLSIDPEFSAPGDADPDGAKAGADEGILRFEGNGKQHKLQKTKSFEASSTRRGENRSSRRSKSWSCGSSTASMASAVEDSGDGEVERRTRVLDVFDGLEVEVLESFEFLV